MLIKLRLKLDKIVKKISLKKFKNINIKEIGRISNPKQSSRFFI